MLLLSKFRPLCKQLLGNSKKLALVLAIYTPVIKDSKKDDIASN